ncbi:unnamed protein product [Mesocestoides corti]|uniref:Uncharacterized protein n=1 Tax=Mesocestoides corti TaxID=53468 RepID=A0A0R3UH40_MESCO|nr:unnamed protein product [Mesocestoides corti]
MARNSAGRPPMPQLHPLTLTGTLTSIRNPINYIMSNYNKHTAVEVSLEKRPVCHPSGRANSKQMRPAALGYMAGGSERLAIPRVPALDESIQTRGFRSLRLLDPIPSSTGFIYH